MDIEIHQRWNPESRKFEPLECMDLKAFAAKNQEIGRCDMLKSILNMLDQVDKELRKQVYDAFGRNRL